ncbi:MAG: hypothetical protein WC421_03460 [Elusimicrobiales bacterium]
MATGGFLGHNKALPSARRAPLSRRKAAQHDDCASPAEQRAAQPGGPEKPAASRGRTQPPAQAGAARTAARAAASKSGPQAPSAQDAGEFFLEMVCRCADISSALRKSGFSLPELYGRLLSDHDFRSRFDERASLKLELAAFDTALRGNAALTGFLLSNRLPDRYRKGALAPKTAQPPQIVFVAHDSGAAHED